jgi:RNA polymerase sigma-70 factor (ECF subfamily)
LRAFALRLTRRDAALADDLVQDACVNALRASDRYELGTNMDAWLATILRNRFLSVVKRRGRRVETSDDEIVQRTPAVGVPQQGRLDILAVEDALAELRPDERRTLLMAATEDLSYQQIADKFGCAVGTVKSRVSRARSHLVHALEHGSDRISA